MKCLAVNDTQILTMFWSAGEIQVSEKKCSHILNRPKPSGWCAAYWDQLGTCWDHTPNGETVQIRCPDFLNQPNAYTSKTCSLDGEWIKEVNGTRTYSQCLSVDAADVVSHEMKVYYAGYSISIVALVIALSIFSKFRSLQCTRISIHKHLFMSFILTDTIGIIYQYVVSDTQITGKNQTWCKVLVVINFYFIISNFAWMFCEGLYLHSVLMLSTPDTNHPKILFMCMFIGWGVPIFPMVAYSYLRATCVIIYGQSELCWVQHVPELRRIIDGSTGFFLVMSFIFLASISRIMYVKLKAQVNSSEPGNEKVVIGTLRGLLVLTPLLGFHNLFKTVFDLAGHGSHSVVEQLLKYSDATFTSLHGFIVALVLCAFNNETQTIIKTRLRQFNLRRNNNLKQLNRRLTERTVHKESVRRMNTYAGDVTRPVSSSGSRGSVMSLVTRLSNHVAAKKRARASTGQMNDTKLNELDRSELKGLLKETKVSEFVNELDDPQLPCSSV